MTLTNDPVLMERDGHVAVLRLNRPPRNTMTPELMARFLERAAEIQATPEIRAVVVTAGEGHFCAGAELGAGMPGVAQALGGSVGVADRLRQVYTPFLGLLDLPVPTVAAVRGAAVGGGLGLAVACDFRVVTPRTRFIAPFAKLGIHPGMGLTAILPMLIGLPRAQEMLLLGEEVRGERALDWGLAHRCVPNAQCLDAALSLAHRAAAGAPAVIRWTKRAVHRAVQLDPRAAADVESLAQALTFSTEDAKEGMAAFFAKRTPDFKGR